MATYHRDFLVPYLQNLCALHIAKRQVAKRHYAIASQIDACREGKSNPAPLIPDAKRIGCGTVSLFAFGIFSMIGFVTMAMDNGAGSLLFVLFLTAAVPIGIGIWSCYNVKKMNEESAEWYRRRMSEYDYIKKQNEAEAKKIPALENELKRCEQEMKKIKVLLQSAYDVNIVPSRYRDIYTAVYLYDWFATSRADDLDHALSMFVLEEIKDRLDSVIQNQSQQMLNQRIMIANQYKSLEQQEAHARDMRAKLSEMQITMDEQLYYERIIESETRATAYFAASDYIRRL